MIARTYEVQDGWVVAVEGWGWLPGYYDSEEAARDAAFETPLEVLEELSTRICHQDGEKRPITLDDLRSVR